MPNEGTPQQSEGLHPMVETPVLCLRGAQWLAVLILLFDLCAWIGAAAIWPLLAYLGLCLLLLLAGAASVLIVWRVLRGAGSGRARSRPVRAIGGFYGATGIAVLNLVMRGGASPDAGSVTLIAMSFVTFALLLWAGGDQARLDAGLGTDAAAGRGKNTEPPTGVY
jgi:hypothetical protein